MRFAVAVFDLDGTLLDTLADLADSTNAALAAAGHPPHPIDAYRYFIGNGIENLVRCALPATARDDASVARAKAAMEAEYSRRWQAKTQPYAGVPELLDALSERQMPMAILSNKPQAFTRLAVDVLLPRWSFHPVCGAQPDVPRKPDPAAALYIAAALGHSPEECLYLGDTDTDMQTATRAGMYALGATWGFRSGDELRRSGARDLLDAPLDLLNFL